jgi:hypothetical protein
MRGVVPTSGTGGLGLRPGPLLGNIQEALNVGRRTSEKSLTFVNANAHQPFLECRPLLSGQWALWWRQNSQICDRESARTFCKFAEG